MTTETKIYTVQEGYWPWDYQPAEGTPVESWTLAQCEAYCAAWDESYGEQYAEAGSGAMSLGYGTDGAYEAANAVTRPTSDPDYVAAQARSDAARQAAWEAKQAERAAAPVDTDSIPF